MRPNFLKAVTALLGLLCATYDVHAQSFIKLYGTGCVGDQHAYRLNFCNDCTSIQWSVPGSHTSVNTSSDGLEIGGFWWTNNNGGAAQLTVTYNLPQGGSGSQQYSQSLSNKLNLEVYLGIAGSPVCVGVSVTLNASQNYTYGTQTYQYYIDNSPTPYYTGNSASVPFPTAGLSAGQHFARVYITNSGFDCFNIMNDWSDYAYFTVVAKHQMSVHLQGPEIICQNTTSVDIYALVDNPIGSLTYQWVVNGAPEPEGTSNFFSLTANENNSLHVLVRTSDWCTVEPEQSIAPYVVHKTAMTNPTGSITFFPVDHCPGSTINLGVSTSPAGSTFDWRNAMGTQISTTSTASIVASAMPVGGTFYNDGGDVTVTVGLSGTCLAAGSIFLSTATTPLNVHPVPTATAMPQTICSGQTTSVSLSGPVPGTTFPWTVSPSGVGGASNSSGAVTAISQTLTNTTGGSGNGTVTYSITPTANGCQGPLTNVIVTVKPTPTITNTAPQLTPSICSGTALNFLPTYSFSGPTVTWTTSTAGNIQPGSVSTSGSGTITNTPVNTGNTNATVTYAMTPQYNGCTGPIANYVVTVKPIPSVSSNPLSRTICNGQGTNLTFTNPNGVSGTTINWAAVGSNTTGASSGSGPAGSVVNQTINLVITNSPGSASYTVYSTAAGCNGSGIVVPVTVNPIPTVSAPSTKTICSGDNVNITITNPNSVAGTQYTWTLSNVVNVSGSSGQSTPAASPIWQVLTSTTGNTAGAITYTITPVAANCSGSSVGTIVTVNPVPTVAVNPGMQTICSGTPAIITITNPNNVNGTALTWTVSAPGISGASNGSGGSINQTLTAATPQTAAYTVTASALGCFNVAIPTVLVNPSTATVPTFAGNERFGPGTLDLTASGAVSGQGYRWYNTSGGLLSSTNSLTTSTISSSGSGYYYAVIVNNYNCNGPNTWVPISIWPIPSILSTADYVFMGSTATLSTQVYDSYTWKKNTQTVGTSPSHITGIPDTYTVTVIKNGLTATSPSFVLKSQFADQNANYVITREVQVDGVTSQEDIGLRPVSQVSQTVQYFDGVGRPLQAVGTQSSPLTHDLVQPMWYDKFGREVNKYLPTVSEANGWYKENLINTSSGTPQPAYSSFYDNIWDDIADDPQPYAKSELENSPLGRPLKVGSPGQAWDTQTGAYVLKSYGSNSASEVLMFKFNTQTQSLSLGASDKFFPPNTLAANKTTDEEGNDTTEYLDKDGRLICKKVKATSSEYAYTYYIYDDFGNLAIVLPPEAVKKLNVQP